MINDDEDCRSVNPETPIPVDTCLPEGVDCFLGELGLGSNGECDYDCPLPQYSPDKVRQNISSWVSVM